MVFQSVTFLLLKFAFLVLHPLGSGLLARYYFCLRSTVGASRYTSKAQGPSYLPHAASRALLHPGPGPRAAHPDVRAVFRSPCVNIVLPSPCRAHCPLSPCHERCPPLALPCTLSSPRPALRPVPCCTLSSPRPAVSSVLPLPCRARCRALSSTRPGMHTVLRTCLGPACP